jgi:DNA sulfur modification protein DndC
MSSMLKDRMALIQRLYTGDSRPWIVAYSGGKDSTAVLQLVWHAVENLPLRERKKTIHIAYVDTGMEHPAYLQEVSANLDRVRAAAVAKGMPFEVRLLEPEMKHRYFVSVLGRGYAPPTHFFRWCTRSLRIRPMSKFIRDHIGCSGAVVLVLGLRKSESEARRRTIEKFASDQNFLGAYGGDSNATAFTPIEDFSAEQVWQFLMQSPSPWGGGNRSLSRLYTLANSGECPSVSLTGNAAPSCGGSRFGCWTCTVVRRDKTGEALAESDDRYESLLEFRNKLARIREDKSKRWKTRRNGEPGMGPLRLSVRRQLLDELLQIQRHTKFHLISTDELKAIRKLWKADGAGRGGVRV